MCSTLAAVSGSAADASTESSIPSFLDPTTLPICAKPGPQKPSSSPPKSIYDPTTPHCAVAPANAGLQLKGVDNNKFLRLDMAQLDQFNRDNGMTGPVVKGAACSPSCNNGVGEENPSGNRHGVQAGLMAQNPQLFADHQAVYNWTGVQTQSEFFSNIVQIGIAFNSWPNDGEFCGGFNNKQNAPMIATQSARNGTYSRFACWPGYIFGIGSTTYFAVTDNTGGWWNAWVNWNGQWQALIGYRVEPMTGANAIGAVVPAEALVGSSVSGSRDPLLRTTIRDSSLLLNSGGANWNNWSVNTRQFQDGPYCPISFISVNGSWSEVSDCQS